MIKICVRCGVPKSKDDFSPTKNTLDGRRGVCKECVRKATDPKKQRESRIQNTYKVAYEDISWMYSVQEGKCKICGCFKPTFSNHGGLVIDHDHNTGAVRGLLCSTCNNLLGTARDNVDTLLSAISYLNSFK